MPPATAQRHVKRHRVLVTLRQRLHIGDVGLPVLGIGNQHVHVAGQAGRIVGLHQRKCLRGVAAGFVVRLQGFGVMLQRLEHIGHLREGGEHGAAIVLKRRLIGIDRRPAIEPARTALEYRRLHRGLPAPEPVFVLAQIAHVLGGRTVIPAQRDGWKQRCGRHADVGAGLMQTSFRREYVRPLPHQVRWQADRQGGRQPQVFQAQLRHARFPGCLAEQAVQQVIGLIALELQRRQ